MYSSHIALPMPTLFLSPLVVGPQETPRECRHPDNDASGNKDLYAISPLHPMHSMYKVGNKNYSCYSDSPSQTHHLNDFDFGNVNYGNVI